MKIFYKTPKAFVFPVALLCSSVWADISYIDENGAEIFVKEGGYTVLDNDNVKTSLAAGWYVVEGHVNFDKQIYCTGDVHLILADGAELVGEKGEQVTGTPSGIYVGNNFSLTIYGQKKQSGAIRISGFNQGIGADNISILGGGVDIRNTESNGIYATGDLVIKNSSVYVSSNISHGISVQNGTLTIDGAKVEAVVSNSNHGIYAKTIVLDWSKNTSSTSINASSIYLPSSPSNITIAEGKSFINDNELYSGSVPVEKIINKTMVPYDPPIVSTAEGAVVNGNYNGVNTIAESYLAAGFVKSPASVTINRNFSVGTYSTLMLPFDVNTANLTGVQEILRYSNIEERNNKDVIVMKRVWNASLAHQALAAYTPYMVKMSSSTLEVDGGVTFADSTSTGTVVDGDCVSECVLKFYGSFAYKKWTDDELNSQTVYGFAAEDLNSVKVGQFVKVGGGASIRPFRAYMANMANTINTNGNGKPVVSSNLPDEIDVVVDDDEHTTVIGRLNTRSGEFMMNRDYDLKGRHVGNKAKVQGAYYGKKVLKK